MGAEGMQLPPWWKTRKQRRGKTPPPLLMDEGLLLQLQLQVSA